MPWLLFSCVRYMATSSVDTRTNVKRERGGRAAGGRREHKDRPAFCRTAIRSRLTLVKRRRLQFDTYYLDVHSFSFQPPPRPTQRFFQVFKHGNQTHSSCSVSSDYDSVPAHDTLSAIFLEIMWRD